MPRLVAADAAFYSDNNEKAAKAKGVKRVCIPKPRNQKPGKAARAKEALVPPGPEMAHRMRGPHQRRQTPARPQPLPHQGRCRNETLGRAWRHRRQPHQHRRRHGEAVLAEAGRPIACHHQSVGHRIGGPALNSSSPHPAGPPSAGFRFARAPSAISPKIAILRQKVAS